MKGGSVGNAGESLVREVETEAEAKAVAKRMTSRLSPGEKQYYKIRFYVKPIKASTIRCAAGGATFAGLYIFERKNLAQSFVKSLKHEEPGSVARIDDGYAVTYDLALFVVEVRVRVGGDDSAFGTGRDVDVLAEDYRGWRATRDEIRKYADRGAAPL